MHSYVTENTAVFWAATTHTDKRPRIGSNSRLDGSDLVGPVVLEPTRVFMSTGHGAGQSRAWKMLPEQELIDVVGREFNCHYTARVARRIITHQLGVPIAA